MYRAAVRLVVERDVPGHDRQPQRLAGRAHPLDRLGELPADLGLLRVAEVEAVGEAEGLSSGTGDVARSLEHGERAARERVETRDAALAVECHREPAERREQPQHGRIEARSPHGPVPDELVVAAEDELAASEVRRPEELEQRLSGRRRGRDPPRRLRRARRARDLIARACVGQEMSGDLAHELALPERAELSRLGDLADHSVVELPAVEDLLHRVEHLRTHERDHALLALGDHHLPRLHSLLAQRYAVEPDVDAELGGHLGQRGGDPRGAAVLERLDDARGHELDRGLDQLLARERVADLHRGALLGGAFVELLACEHRRAADPVAPSRRAVDHDVLPAAGRLRTHDAGGREESDAHGVHEAVVAVGLVEDRLAADRRHAHRVPVRGDPADRARELVTRLAEAEPVEEGDGPRAHGDDVAEDPADAGGGALERLDRRGVVVALDLERDRDPVTEIEHARVLARAL